LKFLGGLLSLVGRHKLSFHQMVSSNAMLTLVMDQHDCDAFIDLLSSEFVLPCSHAPFEQEQNQELTQFLKKKYPETRASYVEEKIKTYGISLTSDLNLFAHVFSFDELTLFGQKLLSMEEKEDTFFHIFVRMVTSGQTQVFLLTGTSKGMYACQSFPADFLSFHGPHFGDRHSIISRAMTCLLRHKICVLQVGCTGAHIGIVLPKGFGEKARHALKEVFESP